MIMIKFINIGVKINKSHNTLLIIYKYESNI